MLFFVDAYRLPPKRYIACFSHVAVLRQRAISDNRDALQNENTTPGDI